MVGLTPEGLEIKRLPDVITSMQERAIEVFSDLVEPNDEVDTSESSTIGRIIGITADNIADVWEALQQVYWAYNPETATGAALDNLVSFAGISRRQESATKAEIYIEGTIGGTVLAGSQIRSRVTNLTYTLDSNVLLSLTDSIAVGVKITTPVTAGNYVFTYQLAGSLAPVTVTIPRVAGETQAAAFERIADYIATNVPILTTYVSQDTLFIKAASEYQTVNWTVTTPFTAVKTVQLGSVTGTTLGAIEEIVESLSIIATPSMVWDRVWNPYPASTGNDKEQDDELRLRFRDTKFQRGTNVIESLYSALYSLSGVEEVFIIENDTDEVDVHGNPPHSFLVLVEGGLNSQIATAIWRNRPLGIQSNGSISVNIIDSFGYTRAVKFSRPTYVPIKMELTLTKGPDFPINGEELIRDAVMAQIEQYGIADDVIYSRLYTPVNSVQGHQVDLMEIGKLSGSLGTTNITIDYDQRAVLTRNNIVFV